MSTVKTNNVQVGQSVTATDNFTLYQPATPDGTVRLGVGNSGATTSDIVTITNTAVGIANTAPACALDVTGGLQTSRTGVTSPAATDGNIFSGTYTPTLTNTTNVVASTAYTCQYMRVGSVVTVSGRVDIDPSAQQDTVLGVSLPIASNFSANENLGGTFVSQQATDAKVPGVIYADSTNDRATFFFRPTVSTNQSYTFIFTYRVI